MFKDLREYIDKVRELGEYKLLEGADWNLEIGAIAELGHPNGPLLMFDNIKDYPRGFRLACNMFLNSTRTALALGLDTGLKGIPLVQAWREKTGSSYKPIPPVEVENAKVKENILTGDDIDLFKFPVPKWHEFDGGRYIGTGDLVITRDPEEGWVNLGVYRVQVHDKSVATIYMSPGRHGDIMRRKYWAKGIPCPAAVALGQEPLLWAMGCLALPWGISEYEYAGWVKGNPIEITKGVMTDLPIPASAEIVLEGEIVPPWVETRKEGPFGEWTGHYGTGARPEPVFAIKSILFRNNPILQGSPPRFDSFTLGKAIVRAARIWDDLDRQVPGVKGVWIPTEIEGPAMAVVSLSQKYPGHVKHAALVTAGSQPIAYMGRFIIIVDDDIDPSDMSQVIWALGTRCNPETIDIIRGCWGSPIDASLPPDKRSKGDFTHSTAIVDACKPYHWRDQFPKTATCSRELLNATREKWGRLLEK